ncbi:YciI family protein [Streptosporangium sp. NPDC001559]|uniref:YciI family protein n=1 Tax=Streptosporangium sp. NPDC001559 TaxID=3366187 RepID=UPI0036E85010
MLMSHIDPSGLAALSPDAHQAAMERFVSFTQALADSGVLRGAERLQAAETATTVRVRDERTLLTDGPYADLTESFGGFWIVEAPDLDAVLAYADGCPAAEYGSLEIRPLAELG